MFGWEFPPFNSGGLGTACHGLTKSLARQGVNITFVLPKKHPVNADFMKVVSPEETLEHVQIHTVDSLLAPYMDAEEYNETISLLEEPQRIRYGRNLFEEVELYAKRARHIVKKEKFDVIHVHDWLTYKAGIIAKRISHRHLVAHIHATEFDRAGGPGHPYVHQIEKQGFEAADRIIAVSNYTKDMVVKNYHINPKKIRVVHNGVELDHAYSLGKSPLNKQHKVIMFHGRITLQKGPDYFVYAAKKILEVYPDARFVMVGDGDMKPWIMNKVAEMGMAGKFFFTGWMKGGEATRVFQMADVFIMPSVSEPFGIAPLESMSQGTPALISKQSGVSEVLTHCLKSDFWDIHDLANKALAVLRYPALKHTLSENGLRESKHITWDEAAKKTVHVYNEVIN